MAGLLAKLLTYCLKKSLRSHAEVTHDGIAANIGLLICGLPLLVAVFFGLFANLAISDPDPGDKIVGYVVAALALGVLLIFAYFISYRIKITYAEIICSSFIGEKIVRLSEPFELIEKPDEARIIVKQGKTRIKVDWILNGHKDIRDKLFELRDIQVKLGRVSHSDYEV